MGLLEFTPVNADDFKIQYQNKPGLLNEFRKCGLQDMEHLKELIQKELWEKFIELTLVE